MVSPALKQLENLQIIAQKSFLGKLLSPIRESSPWIQSAKYITPSNTLVTKT